MLTTIGLIVATYAVARLLQLPFEVTPARGETGIPGTLRLILVSVVSACSILILTILVFVLLRQDVGLGELQRGRF
jgi:hypothetical protein